MNVSYNSANNYLNASTFKRIDSVSVCENNFIFNP